MQHSKCCVRNVPRVRIPNSPPKREVMLWHCFSFLFGIRTRREQTCLRKKTVRWTVFADVVKEQSDAKAYGSMPKKSLTLRQSGKQVARPAFAFAKQKRDSNKEGADLSAEENSLADCFRRRGQGAKRREGIHLLPFSGCPVKKYFTRRFPVLSL